MTWFCCQYTWYWGEDFAKSCHNQNSAALEPRKGRRESTVLLDPKHYMLAKKVKKIILWTIHCLNLKVHLLQLVIQCVLDRGFIADVEELETG